MEDDLISRSDAIKRAKAAEIEMGSINGIKAVPMDAVIQFLEIVPAVDAAEVTHCKDCRYYFNGACAHPKNLVATKVPDFGEHYVYLSDLVVPENHHCGYGERRDNDGASQA